MTYIESVRKRDGQVVPFDLARIEDAILKAARAVDNGVGRQWAVDISLKVLAELDVQTNGSICPSVEAIQDVVEEVLIGSGHPAVAKAYILYREQRAQVRETEQLLLDGMKLMDDYLDRLDWRVKENSNMNYSLQGLNFHVASSISARYWLNKIYPSEVQDAHVNGDFHIHDLSVLAAYCCGWDLQDLLIQGFGGVAAKIECKPPKHFGTALGQLVNFFYTLQGETAGAQAVSNFDTLLAPFVRFDSLSYPEVKQAMQEFIFNMNVPTRVGFQSLIWDELVIVKRNGRIQVAEIGQLVDEQFVRNTHRVLSQGNDSYAVVNTDDIQALSFDSAGKVVWTPVKAFVRHRVPDGSPFVCVRTSRGTASVSQAHSLFAFDELDGRFSPRPMAARDVDTVHGNTVLTPTNHFISVRLAPNGGTRDTLDLVELIDTVSQVAARTRVRIPDHAQAVDRLRKRVNEKFGGFTPFYLEYGINDKGCWKRWTQSGAMPYLVWRAFGENEPEVSFAMRNSDLWYARMLPTESLDEFVRLLAWYITEGHNDITNGLYVSQARGGNQEEITRVLNALQALGRVEEMKGWSALGNPTSVVLRMAGKGLLAALIGYLGGTYSTNKVIPWFIYDLTPDLQEIFIATLICGDGSEYTDHYDYHTTSKKLSLGLSLLLAMNHYKFSVYETTYEQENWNDQYILRMYKDKSASERCAVGDLLARVCTRRETFAYDREYEYDLSVDTELENFAGGSGLLCFHNTPFTNLTMDLTPSSILRDQPVIIGGEAQDVAYGDFQPEMDLVNRAFAEILLEGDAKGRVFTFPIPTYNITREFDWENPVLEPLWRMTAKYGIPYFSNFINSDMDPDDARSMCCRLRLDNRELRRRGGGLFGANPLTGSIGVVTLNMPRIGYLAADEADYFAHLGRIMETAKTSLEIKRKVLNRLTRDGLYPYSRYYLEGIRRRFGDYWANHFSTIGLTGMNESCLNFLGVSIAHPKGKEFAIRVLEFMRKRLERFQDETDYLYNLEATPAESAAFRLAKADKSKFHDIRAAGTNATPYYTNSTHLPVGFTDDFFEALEHQDDLQKLYTGGTVLHGFLGERIEDWRQARLLVKRIAENFSLPYYTLTPTFSICPVHGYIPGEHPYCPHDHSDEELERFGV